MSEHFTFLGTFANIHDPITQKFISAIALALLIIFFAWLAYSKVSSLSRRRGYIIPRRFGLVGLFDFFVESFVHYHDSILGVENRKYVPLCGSVFLFIFLSNIFGLIPGMAAITTTVVINLSIAIVVFVYFNALGIKTHGLVGYLKHFAGPVLLIAPLMFAIEVFSTTLRVLTLNLRLYWNISADHIVMSAFMDLHPICGVVAYFLGFFVAFMQAFVFATLTIIYIQLAVQHSEEE